MDDLRVRVDEDGAWVNWGDLRLLLLGPLYRQPRIADRIEACILAAVRASRKGSA